MHKTLNRRTFLKGSAAAAACAGMTGAARAEGRPLNLLFLMTDMHNIASLSAYGCPYIQTPNIDRIAREGVRFENAACVTPYCSPSRATMISGVYPHTHRILVNVTGRGKQAPLSPDAFPNTEMMLHARGYATAHRGKWHLGDTGDFPCYESWEYAGKDRKDYARYLEAHMGPPPKEDASDPGRYEGYPVEKIPAIREGYKKFNAIPGNSLGRIANIGRSVIPPEFLPETRITDQVLGLLDAHAGEPFMITASWSPPHDIWVIPEPYYSMVPRESIVLTGRGVPPWDEKGASKVLGDCIGEAGIREYVAIYLGMVKYIDDQVGRVLNKLDALGLAANTLVVFTSDHGDMMGAHGVVGKSITSIYDGLLRVPLAMRLPGIIPAGKVVRKWVSQIDYMPTFLDYLGVPAPAPIHGRSMRPLIEGNAADWRDYVFCQRADSLRMLRTDRYKYTWAPNGRVLSLYDMQADPEENENLAKDPKHRDTLVTMHERLHEVMRKDGDPLEIPPAETLLS